MDDLRDLRSAMRAGFAGFDAACDVLLREIERIRDLRRDMEEHLIGPPDRDPPAASNVIQLPGRTARLDGTD